MYSTGTLKINKITGSHDLGEKGTSNTDKYGNKAINITEPEPRD